MTATFARPSLAEYLRELTKEPEDVVQFRLDDALETIEHLEREREQDKRVNRELVGEVFRLDRELKDATKPRCQSCGRVEDAYGAKTEKCSRKGRYACTRRR